MSEYKTIFGIVVLPAMILCATVLAIFSRRLRELFFFLFTLLCLRMDHLNVNFVSREWYRGTSRGFEVSLLDVLSVAVFAGSLIRPYPGRPRWYWPASFGLMLVYFVYCVFSVTISDPQLFGLFELTKILRGFIVFLAAALFVRSSRELNIMVFALACVACWQGVVTLQQRYLDGFYRVEGTIGNPNSLSMFLCMITPLLVAAFNAEGPRLLKALCAAGMLGALVAVLLTISRAGTATLVVVMLGSVLACASFKFTLKKMAIGLLGFAIAGGLFAKAWSTIEARYDETTLADEYKKGHTQNRGYYIKIAEAIAQDRFFGVGLNNWSYHVSNEYGPQLGWQFVPYIGTENWPSDKVPPGRDIDAAQAAPAHNLGALTLGELGIPGFIIFTLLWMRWFQMGASFLFWRVPDPTLRLGAGIFFCTCGIFMQSLTEWVYRQTAIFFTFHILMGALASMYQLKRERKLQEFDEFEDEEEFEETDEIPVTAES